MNVSAIQSKRNKNALISFLSIIAENGANHDLQISRCLLVQLHSFDRHGDNHFRLVASFD